MSDDIYQPSSDVVDRPSTPDEAAQLDAARAKLSEMTGRAPAPSTKPRPTGPPAHIPSARRRADDVPPGRTHSSPDAAALAASQSQVSAVESRIKELNHPDSPLWKTGTPEGDAARDELRRLLAEAATDDEKQEVADRPLGLLRDQFNVNTHDMVLAPLHEKWDTHEEGTVLATFAQQGVSPEAVSAIMTWYTGIFNGALGNAANINAVEIEAQFRALAKKHGVADDVVDALVEHHRGRLQ